MSNTSVTNWERVDALSTTDIDTSDIPLLDEAFFARSTWRLPKTTMPGDTTITLAPDVAAVFTDAAAVNEALRFLIKVTKDNTPQAILSPAP